MSLIQTAIIFAAIIFALLFERAARKYGIGAVPVLPWQRTGMITALKSHTATDTPLNIAELGCGWGGLIAALHQANKSAKITGLEGFMPAYLTSRLRFIVNKNITIRRADFMHANLSDFNVVMCYLSHGHMQALRDKFQTELKPGSLIISNAFPIPDWTPINEITTKAVVTHKIYIYRV